MSQESKLLSVVILAGGLAKRMRPITETIPKALIEVAGKPFIFHQLNYLYEQGVQNVVICAGYLGEMIQSEVGTGEKFGLHVKYSFDGPDLLGTGGALKKALPFLAKEFFVMYGDSYLPINFSLVQNYFYSCKKIGLMTIIKNRNQWDKSNVDFVNGNLLEYNKKNQNAHMAYIDYGLAVISAKVFDQYTNGTSFDLADVYEKLSMLGNLAGFEVHERFYEIGSNSGLKETRDFFTK